MKKASPCRYSVSADRITISAVFRDRFLPEPLRWIYVFYTSIKMIISNIRGILTNDEENNEIKAEIINELKEFNELEFKKVKIIKMSNYYRFFESIEKVV